MYVFGNTLAATTVVTGAAASVGAAAAYGYYELNKAVVVPAGYGFGSGLVMSYGTLSHLGAHTMLAVSILRIWSYRSKVLGGWSTPSKGS